MGETTDDTAGYARKSSQPTSDASGVKSKTTKPAPKKAGVMFEAHRARELVSADERQSTKKSPFSFAPSTLEFRDAKDVEVRIYNDTDEVQTIDEWQLVGDTEAFATKFIGARSVPLQPHASVAFRVAFMSDATAPQAAALIVRTMSTDQTARLDLVGIQQSMQAELVDDPKDTGVSIEARTDAGRPNSISTALGSVASSFTAVALKQSFALTDLRSKMSAPSEANWKDELIEEALGFGLSEAIGAVGLFLGGGLALAAWNVVDQKLHLGREVASAAAKEIAHVTVKVHELVTNDLALAASKKVGQAFREKMSDAKAKEREQDKLRDAFFDAQATTITEVYANAVTSLNNHEGDYAALEAQHAGFGFAALEAYRSHLYAQRSNVIEIQRNKTLGQWLSLLARLKLGVHQPESKDERVGSAVDQNLYATTDAHHRISGLASGVIELHVDWNYDRMSDQPLSVLHARVVGVKDAVREMLTQAPLKAFGAPMVVYGKVIRERPEGIVSHSHMGIGRNEGGTVWLGATQNTDGSDMLMRLGNGDPYEGARKILVHVDNLQLSRID